MSNQVIAGVADAPISPEVPTIAMTTPRAGMSLGTDYFGIEGPGCAEWVKESIVKAHEERAPFVGFVHHKLAPSVIAVPARTVEEWQHRIDALRMEIERHGLKLTAVISHPDEQEAEALGSPAGKANEEQVDSVGPTSKTIALCLSTATQAQLISALSAIQNELVSRHQAVTWVRPEQEVAILMSELEDQDSILNQGLAAALDARELDMNVCYPYLQEDVYIESCPIVGKGAIHCCKHLIGRLDYCDQCEHEHDEPIDLSGESI